MIPLARVSRLAALLLALFVAACYQGPAPQAAIKNGPVDAAPPSRQKPALDKAQLIASARAGGDYLLRLQKSDGSFQYSYDPLTDQFDNRQYNILRHAGTAYALFQLYGATREGRYLDGARQAMRFLRARFQPARGKDAVYVLDFDGKAKLGANGLALIALVKQLEFDAQNASLEDARRLANLILALQHKDGSFSSYHPVRGDEPEGNVSLYYPGEAILGLVGLYKRTGDNRYLEAGRRAAVYLIDSQQRFHDLPPDAWLTQALEALDNIRHEPKYGDHAIAIAMAMASSQYTEEDSPEYAGGFSPGVPRSTPAASRAEGILAAYRMAKAANDPRAVRLASALILAARFQLSQQFGDDDPYHLPDPRRAKGGFRESLDGLRVRIDFVQHNISALLGVAETLY